jgi:hypothetical protein
MKVLLVHRSGCGYAAHCAPVSWYTFVDDQRLEDYAAFLRTHPRFAW